MTVEERERQRLDALTRANEVRIARARLKQQLAVGVEDAHRLLREPPEVIEGVEVEEFLTWVPKIGRVKAQKIVRKAQVNPTKRIGSLTERARVQIVMLLAETPAYR